MEKKMRMWVRVIRKLQRDAVHLEELEDNIKELRQLRKKLGEF